MNYKQATDYLSGSIRMRYNLGLSRMEEMLAKLGNPERSIKAIHVAGTKGKGSTCAFIEQAFRDSGLKTGLYTSPDLMDIRERMQVNRRNITKGRFAEIATKVKAAADQLQDQPTFFELVTAMAFLYFFEEKVDYAVLEVGMGGRLDATNICSPALTIITNISFDHVEFLGDTLEKIAGEKAGIIKQNVPVVTAVGDDVFGVIKKIADSKSAPITRVSGAYEGKLRLRGDFQKENAAIAFEAVKQLGLGIPAEKIRESFRVTKWAGRLQKKGNILLDCAHNVASFEALAHELRKMKYDRLIPIFSISIEKDLKGIFEILNPLVESVIVTKTPHYRAEDPEKIVQYARNPMVKHGMKEALDYAKSIAGKNDLILITGCYGVGEAMKLLHIKAG